MSFQEQNKRPRAAPRSRGFAVRLLVVALTLPFKLKNTVVESFAQEQECSSNLKEIVILQIYVPGFS